MEDRSNEVLKKMIDNENSFNQHIRERKSNKLNNLVKKRNVELSKPLDINKDK